MTQNENYFYIPSDFVQRNVFLDNRSKNPCLTGLTPDQTDVNILSILKSYKQNTNYFISRTCNPNKSFPLINIFGCLSFMAVIFVNFKQPVLTR